MSRLRSPLVVGLLGLLSGSATGLAWFWLHAQTLVAKLPPRAVASRVTAEEKAKGWDFWTIEIDNLSSELKDEKARLRQESEQLDLRAARLASEREDLERLRADLEGMRKDITDHVVEIQANESKNLRMLAQTYTSLSPHGAVAIIHELDDATAVKILSLMKPDVVGSIFEDMAGSNPASHEARRAAILSEKLRLMKAQKPGATS